MKKALATMFFTLFLAVAAVPPAAPKPAAAQDLEQQLAQLDQQLTQEQAKLDKLNDSVERAQGQVDALNRKLAEDKQKEADLDQQVTMLARAQYERPALTISTILEAPTLDELVSNIAQARLVAHRQQAVQGQAKQLRHQDEQIRDQQAGQLAEIKSAKDEAAAVVTKTLAMRNTVNDQVLAARAQALAAQAQATQIALVARPAGPVAGGAPGPNHFAYGYCTWHVANLRYIPWYGNAIEWWANARPYGYAEGASPAVGAVMVTRESSYGHVAYVTAVNGDGSWTVSEMNYVGWNIVSTRTIHPGQVPLMGFIYGKA